MGVEVKLKYRAHPRQAEVHADPHRFRVLIAGRRFGKTMTAVAEITYQALTYPKSRVWFIAPTFRQAKTTAWRVLLDLLPIEVIRKKNEQDLEIVLTNGSEIALKGTERPDLLRGVGLDGVVLDEVAFMKSDTWETVVRPMLTDTNGWALFIGTPAGFGELWKLAKLGDHDNEIEGDPVDILGEDEGRKLVPNDDWSTHRFTTYDNPYITANQIQSEKETMNEDYFAQEYLARFTRFTGLVYPEFDMATHIIPPIEIPSHWLRAVGVDVGYSNPSAAAFLAVDENGVVYLYDELYCRDTISNDFIDLLKQRIEDRFYQIKVADSAAADFIATARERGLWFSPYKRPEHSRMYGTVGETIGWVKEYLRPQPKTGKPALYVFNHCTNAIREFQTYIWDKHRYASNDKKPKKENDHLLDGMRYAIMEIRGRKSDYSQFDSEGRRLTLKTDVVDKEWDVAAL